MRTKTDLLGAIVEMAANDRCMAGCGDPEFIDEVRAETDFCEAVLLDLVKRIPAEHVKVTIARHRKSKP